MMNTFEATLESLEPIDSPSEAILPGTAGNNWPVDVQAAVLAWDVLGMPVLERRGTHRRPYRQALLLNITDPSFHEQESGVMLFTRDAHPWAVGFITRTPLPLNARGTVHLPRGDRFRPVQCTVHRCKPFLNGWQEGAITFITEQADICGFERACDAVSADS